MPRFLTKPVVVDAMTAGEIRDHSMRDRPRWVQEAITSKRIFIGPLDVRVRTLQETVVVNREDWIVRKPNGELERVRAEHFHRDFEKV